MTKTVKELLAANVVMSTVSTQMAAYRAAYEGGASFKNLVMHRRPSESQPLFNDKRDNTAVMPLCRAITDEIIDIVFENPVKRALAFLDRNRQAILTPAWAELFVQDADYNGQTLSGLMAQAATQASITGWCWIFLDLPVVAARTNRPYVSICAAENVLDWEYENYNGIEYLKYLRVIEYKDSEHTRIKEWYVEDEEGPTRAFCYDIPAKHAYNQDQGIMPDDVYYLEPGRPIPVVQYVPMPDHRRRDVGNSDLTDAYEVQRQVLKLESEAYDSIRFSKPIIRADAGINIPAGGGGIVRATKDQVEVFSIPTADVAEIRAQQASIMDTLDRLSGRGGLRKSESSSRSGVSIIEERRGLHRRAAARARTLEALEECIFRIAANMMSQVWAGEVEYDKDYESRDSEFRLALLQQAKVLSPNNPLVQELIDRQVVAMIAPADQLQLYLQRLEQQMAALPTYAQVEAQEEAGRVEYEADEIEDDSNYTIQDRGQSTNNPVATALNNMGIGRGNM